MMAYTKNNILVQSAQAMLAQANQVPQGVLQLLQRPLLLSMRLHRPPLRRHRLLLKRLRLLPAALRSSPSSASILQSSTLCTT